MTLRVSGKNLAIGEALRTHVHARIDGIVAKYRAGLPTGHVTIEPEGSGYRADCTLFLKAGITLQVEAVAHDPYASFDKAADRIERRLRDHRKRAQGRFVEADAAGPGGSNGAEASDAGAGGSDGAARQADGEEANFPAVVAETSDAFEEMTVAAAVRALDATACPVVVFRFDRDRRINIVYRRPDGNIGWIDPLPPSVRSAEAGQSQPVTRS